MFQEMLAAGSGGGGTLTFVDAKYSASSSDVSYTIDTSKKYVACFARMRTGENVNYCGTAFIENGALTWAYHGASFASTYVSYSGNTLSFHGDTTYYMTCQLTEIG